MVMVGSTFKRKPGAIGPAVVSGIFPPGTCSTGSATTGRFQYKHRDPCPEKRNSKEIIKA